MNEMANVSTNLEEVIKLVKQIDIGKSSFINGINSRILEDAFLSVPDKLTMLFNRSPSERIFPAAWKEATIIPLGKGGKQSNITNFRPVYLLPLPGKLLEKIMHSRMMDFLDHNNLLDKRQGGFRPGHSTIDTISYFTNDLFSAINNNNQITFATFIDF